MKMFFKGLFFVIEMYCMSNIYPYRVDGGLKTFYCIRNKNLFCLLKLLFLQTFLLFLLLLKRPTLKVQENENRLAYFTNMPLEDPQNPVRMI